MHNLLFHQGWFRFHLTRYPFVQLVIFLERASLAYLPEVSTPKAWACSLLIILDPGANPVWHQLHKMFKREFDNTSYSKMARKNLYFVKYCILGVDLAMKLCGGVDTGLSTTPGFFRFCVVFRCLFLSSRVCTAYFDCYLYWDRPAFQWFVGVVNKLCDLLH